MKILLIDKYNYIKGGAERYYFELKKLLEKNGHEVKVFTPKEDKYRFFWSFEMAKEIEKIIVKFKPDVAHVHLLYHHITPSVLQTLKQHKIPVVMTVHDYKLICPNYLLFTGGKPCIKCKKYKYYNCIKYKCIKDSYSKSALVTAEMYGHKLFKSYEKNIDLFISPSEFTKQKLIEFGQDEIKIKVVPHFIELENKEPNYKLGDYLLYFGRLSKEKGVDKIIKALYNTGLYEKLVIAGTGPLEKQLKQMVDSYGMMDQVQFTGHVDDLSELIKNCKFVIFSSEVWETFGLVALEANVFGKMVLANNSGAISEVVLDNQTGIIYEGDLEKKLKEVLNNPDKIIDLGKNARQVCEKKYNPQQHYKEIMVAYSTVIPVA